jgi:hypothetical protein
VPTAAEPEDEPAAADVVEGPRHLGEQGRVAEGGTHHEDPEFDARRRLGHGCHHGPAFVDPGISVGVAEHEVVVAPDRVEAGVLGGPGDRPDVGV